MLTTTVLHVQWKT